jgi:hypothetical protein
MPGDRVETVDNGFQTLNWMGRMTIIPDFSGQYPMMGKLTRFTDNSFGLGRPMPDLVLGPRARIMDRSASCKQKVGAQGAFVPAREYIDGNQVIEVTPVNPVKTYQLGFDGHESVLANGIEIESFHPGTWRDLNLSIEMQQLYLSFFPHVDRIEAFGPMRHPRLINPELETGSSLGLFGKPRF